MSRPNSYVTYVTKLSTGVMGRHGFRHGPSWVAAMTPMTPIGVIHRRECRRGIPDLREAIRESPDTPEGDPVGLHMRLACG